MLIGSCHGMTLRYHPYLREGTRHGVSLQSSMFAGRDTPWRVPADSNHHAISLNISIISVIASVSTGSLMGDNPSMERTLFRSSPVIKSLPIKI